MNLIDTHAGHDTGHAIDGGLAHDLPRMAALAASAQRRRQALRWLAGGATATAAAAFSGAARAACSLVPEETAGPYPGDGSNASGGQVANVLLLSGIQRRDIRSSIGGATGTAAGLPLTVRINLVNTAGSCARLSGYAVYLWHCTREGLYSMYSNGVQNQNYLRGLQVSDEDGTVAFRTVFPGCYAGRMPHIHFEVYRSANTATSFSNKLRTSQMAFPVSICQRIYSETTGYQASVSNLANISFATDNVFNDGYATQLATVGSNISSGVTATLQIGISAV